MFGTGVGGEEVPVLYLGIPYSDRDRPSCAVLEPIKKRSCGSAGQLGYAAISTRLYARIDGYMQTPMRFPETPLRRGNVGQKASG